MILARMGIKNAFKKKIRFAIVTFLLTTALTLIGVAAGLVEPLRDGMRDSQRQLTLKSWIYVQNQDSANTDYLISAEQIVQIRKMKGVAAVCKSDGMCVTCSIGENEFVDYVVREIRDEDKEQFGLLSSEEGAVLQNKIEIRQGNVEMDGEVRDMTPYIGENITIVRNTNYDIELEVPVLAVYEGNGDGHSLLPDMYITETLYQELLRSINEEKRKDTACCLLVFTDGKRKKTDIMNYITKMDLQADLGGEGDSTLIQLLSVFRTSSIFYSVVTLTLVLLLTVREVQANLQMREKSIGLMKAYGCRDLTIMRLTLAETACYGVCAFALSSALLPAILIIVRKRILDLIGCTIDLTFWRSYAVMLLALLLFFAVTNLKPYLLCKKMSPLDILTERR